MIKNRRIAIGYKAAYIIIELIGLSLATGVFQGRFNWRMFYYFTNLSNLACLIYYLIEAIWLAGRPGNDGATVWNARLKGTVRMGILLTGAVAYFLLRHAFDDASDPDFINSLYILHDVIPLMTLLDWILFDQKGLIRRSDPWHWAIFPLAYLAAALALAQFIPLGTAGGSRYPYPFLDGTRLGWGAVALNVAGLALAYILIGFGFYLADRKWGADRND